MHLAVAAMQLNDLKEIIVWIFDIELVVLGSESARWQGSTKLASVRFSAAGEVITSGSPLGWLDLCALCF